MLRVLGGWMVPLLAACFAPPASSPEKLASSQPAEFEPTDWSLRLPRGVRPLGYALEIRLPEEGDWFSGRVRIRAQVTRPTHTVRLHAKQLLIEDASVIFEGHRQALSIIEGKEVEQIEVRSPKPVGPGWIDLDFSYRGLIGVERGAFRTLSDQPFVVTQFQPTDARTVFPCFDEPSFKTPFALTLIVAKGTQTFSNTKKKEVASGPAGLERVSFETTHPIATYQLAFAAGALKTIGPIGSGDTPIRLIVPRAFSKEGGMRVLQAAEKTLFTLERLLEVPHGLKKLDVLGVPEFSIGGMENPGLVTVRLPLTHDDGRGILAHEFAHLWFGDLVTPNWWDDIWLSEAFASWLSGAVVPAVEQNKPPALVAQNTEFDLRLMDASLPVETVDDLRWPRYGERMQPHGYWILARLTHRLGDEAILRVLRNFLQEHKHGTATTADFARAFRASTGHEVDAVLSKSWGVEGARDLQTTGPRKRR